MSTNVAYTIAHTTRWQVAYHQEKDEIVLFYVDSALNCWFYARGILDGVGFAENIKWDKLVMLGDL